MRRVQEILSVDTESSAVDKDESIATASVALKNKQLTFAWLDGEAQKVNHIYMCVCVCAYIHTHTYVNFMYFFLFNCYFIKHYFMYH